MRLSLALVLADAYACFCCYYFSLVTFAHKKRKKGRLGHDIQQKMSVLKQIVLLILAISFMTFLTFFGRLPILRNTPVGFLYKLIWVHFPRAVSAADQRLTSGRLTRSISWLYNRVMYERHPTIVIFFLAIMMVSEYMFIPPVWPQIGWFTKLTTTTVILMPYLFLYLCCYVDPGFITPENHSYYMSLYPYDYANFHPGNKCRTCRFLKPARSKHCDLCKRCVARADHHCVFINSCVGYGNHHWFLLLLGSTALLTSYGGFLGLSLLTTKLKLLDSSWSLWPPREVDFNRYLLVWAWGLNRNIRMGAVTILALLTSPLVGGLFFYSLFLVYCGTTTNESMKWSDYKEEITDGYAYRRPLSPNRFRDLRYEPDCQRWPTDPEHVMLATQDGQPPTPESDDYDDSNERNENEHEKQDNDGNAWVPELGRGRWERVRSLRDVENLYDRGFWHNLCDIFITDYMFGMELSVERDDSPR